MARLSHIRDDLGLLGQNFVLLVISRNWICVELLQIELLIRVLEFCVTDFTQMSEEPNVFKKVGHKVRRTLANLWLNKVHKNVIQIAITGSFGKTSTANTIHAIIASQGPCLMTDINLNTTYNVPITALKLRHEQFIVFELGIDQLNEMQSHLEIVKPYIGIITGITPVHSDETHLKSLDNIIREKRQIIEVLDPEGFALLNYDDPNVRGMAQHTKGKVIWYGTSSKCDLYAQNVQSTLQGIRFKARIPSGTYDFVSPLLGKHSASNLLPAIFIGEMFGISIDQIRRAVGDLQPLSGRLSIEDGPNGLVLVNDSLRANPVSTEAGLRFFSELETQCKKIAVLGEMGELGDYSEYFHRKIGEVAATANLDFLICLGSQAKLIAEEAILKGMPSEKVRSVATPQETASIICDLSNAGDLLYLKGSLLRHMERILMLLQNEVVVCNVASCHIYHNCRQCSYRTAGLQNHQ